jgi:hypothetical protein
MKSIKIVYATPGAGPPIHMCIEGDKVGYEVHENVISVWANTLNGVNRTIIVPMTSLGLVQVDIEK